MSLQKRKFSVTEVHLLSEFPELGPPTCKLKHCLSGFENWSFCKQSFVWLKLWGGPDSPPAWVYSWVASECYASFHSDISCHPQVTCPGNDRGKRIFFSLENISWIQIQVLKLFSATLVIAYSNYYFGL